MDGLSSETLAFLIDIQEHGANTLRALSADFASLGGAADRISKQLATMQAQLDRTSAASAAAGEKVATGAKGAAAATDAQAKATEALATTQKSQVGQADAVTAATDRLTKAQQASAAAGKGSAAGLDAQAAAARRAGGAAGVAAAGTRAHSGALGEHASKLEKAQKGLGSFGRAMNSVSLPIVAVSGYALKMGLDFEAAMQRLHGQAGYAQKDIGGLEAAVLKAAPHLARTPNELADALYHVASVGIPAAHAMQVVSAAAIAANIGNANLENTTNGLVIVMKSLHQPAAMAKEDMALLNEVVGAGNLRMEDLVTSLGKVLPQAQSFGLHLQDVGAAMDVMTSRGINAEMAATRLGMTFNLMGNPSATAQKSLATIGLSANRLAEDMHKPNGLLVAVEDLKAHLDKTFPASGARKLSVEEERAALRTYKTQLEETGLHGKKLTKELEEYAEKLVHMGSAAVQQAQVLSSSFGRGRQSATILTLVQNVDDLRRMYERLPEGAKALERMTEAQDKWEKTSAAQFDIAKATISAAMTEIGKSLGPEVVPVIKDLASDIEGLVHMFKGLPTPVQHTVEEVTALVAVLGPATLLMSKLIGAGRAVGKVGGWVAGKYSGAAAAGVAGEAGAVGAAEHMAGGIFGVRGPAEAGSLLNPIAVQVIGYGGSAGGGNLVGAAERDAAKVEGRTAGGVLLPSGVTVAEDAAGAAGAVGLGSKVLTIGKSLAGGALRGGVLALGGMAVSDIAGGIVGGKTGSAISTIGTDASIGAGIGTLLGPEGTVGGALVGALVGGVKTALDQPSFGQRMADTLGAGMTPAARKAIEDTFNAEHNYRVERARPNRGAGPARVTESNPEAYAGGYGIASSVEHTAERFKFPDLSTFTKEAFRYFDQIPARARSAGIQSIIGWTAGMEANGRLPQGATQKLIASIEKQWPEYTAYLRQVGLGSQRELAKTIEGNVAVEAAKNQIAEVSKTFQGLAPLLKKDGGNAQEQWATTLSYLYTQTKSKLPQVRQAAEDELRKLTANTTTLFAGWTHNLQESLRAGGAGAADNFVAGMKGMVGGIETLMHQGKIATQAGDREIVKLAVGALGALGGNASKSIQKFLEFEAGGRVPGTGLEDTVPIFSPRGAVRGIVAPGELLVANRHTEGRIDRMLAPYGTTLGAEVAGETRPHSAPRHATGGWIRTGATIDPTQGQAPTYSAHGGMSFAELLEAGVNAGKRPDLTQLLGEHRARYGMPMETPILVRAAGGHHAAFRVWKNDVGSGQPGDPHYTIDLHSAIAAAIGFGGKGDIEVARDGTSAAAGRAGAPGTGDMGLKAPPWHGPGGLIGQLGRASVARVLQAARSRIAGAEAASGRATGTPGTVSAPGGAPTGGGYDPAQVGYFDGIPVAKWIIAELNFGRAHGWAGPVTSGIRLGFDPHAPGGSEHALDIYPGGAVDFGGMVDPAGAANRAAFIKATIGYHGKRLLTPIGFRDDGHMSGTGHARGGRVNYAGAFAHGGVHTASSPTMAMFGENGTETAIFVPHNIPRLQTGGELLESIGVTPTPPPGSKKVEGLNPDNNQIEYRTATEWRSIRLHHQQAQKAKGGATQVERQIQLGRMDVGAILDKSGGTIDIPSDVAHLSAQTWKKVVAAIEHTLKETGGPANAAFDVQAVGKLSANAQHNTRLRALAGSAIQDTAKTILTVTRNLPAESAVAGGTAAIDQLRRLIADARRSGNANLTAALRKDIEVTMKGTADAIMQNVAGAPAGRAVSTAAGGVRQLQGLISKARANGAHSLELTLIRDVQKTVTTWQSAITGTATTATEAAGSKEKVRLALRNLATVHSQGGGAKLLKAEADPQYLKEQEAAQTAAIHQMESEKTALGKLVRQLDAQMRKALKKHHKAQAKAIEAEIKEINAQIGEVTTAIGDSTANIATLQIEFAQHVYEEVKSRIAEAQASFESEATMTSLHQQIAAQQAKNAGGSQPIAQFIESVHSQVASLEKARAYDQSQVGSLQGTDRQQLEQKIAELTLNIAQLDGSIQEQIQQKIQEANAEFEGQSSMASLKAQIAQQRLHNQGLDLAGLQEDASRQSGMLTPEQIKQAQTDLESFIQGVRAQETPIQQQLAYDEAHLGELEGPARQQMEQQILALTLTLAQLEGSITDQTHATEQLTEATKTSNNTMAQFTGAVTFTYNNQSYVVGQSSDLSVTPGVGG